MPRARRSTRIEHTRTDDQLNSQRPRAKRYGRDRHSWSAWRIRTGAAPEEGANVRGGTLTVGLTPTLATTGQRSTHSAPLPPPGGATQGPTPSPPPRGVGPAAILDNGRGHPVGPGRAQPASADDRQQTTGPRPLTIARAPCPRILVTMRIIEPDHAGVFDITDLPRQQTRRVQSPVEPDPLAPPIPNFPRFRFTDETFSTSSADSYRAQMRIDEMMISHLARTGPGGFVFITTTS